jgi:putative ABC transport system ATP-binding protein
MESTLTMTGFSLQLEDELTNNTLIRMVNVVKEYHSLSGPIKALKGINLEINRGEFWVITGRSGSGKTTLINLLTGLDQVTSGEIYVDNIAVHRFNQEQSAKWRGQNVGVVFQSFHLIPQLTALQNITLPMDFARKGSLEQRKERGLELLKQVDIEEHAYKLPSQVSGGQQQRIAIARSLVNDPVLVVADEPTGSLDSKTAQSVFQIFEKLAEDGKTVIMVTHDSDFAKKAKHALVLDDGYIR